MTHRILTVGDAPVFVYRNAVYTAWELWMAGLATFGGGW